MQEPPFTQAYLKEHLHYDPDTGEFTWLKPTTPVVKAGQPAGCVATNGYVVIGLKGKLHRAHRLAWLYLQGRWPEYDVDHENRVRHDNRELNLREVTKTQNNQNKTAQSNAAGVPGISWYAPTHKWKTQIRVNKKAIHLGYFDTPEEAYQAYLAAKKIHHPFANLKGEKYDADQLKIP